jgi:transcriptional regulator with XRE-family HTH domain
MRPVWFVVERLQTRTTATLPKPDVTSARVGLEVRRARLEEGLSQAELARRMGVKPPYVAGLEAGTRNVTLGQLANVADALHRGLNITFPPVAAEFREYGRAATR